MEGSAAPNIEHSERRRDNRLQSHFDVDVVLFSGKRAGDQVTGKIINISKVGAGVVLQSELEIGTQIALTVFFEEDQSSCSGTVIWKKDVKGRMVHGIKIVQWSYLDPALARLLPLK